ncbi:hypothetical protein OTSUT76_1392 [Orientia tsutsugamushi str. UT76]|uniref:Conjugal transfer protein n=1 Tax=Orientia tsutsugamushi TaxID=784 RepID=A0A2U3QZS4_ORITS|nr:hypothetical protein [Orientia tsutsugamushi]KJV88008.1 hypothetical protein OTSUT76_1392 [Orientia tsutsugamushi str. UT76]SPR06439.1 conjugal transfer protein [Orientia tsutsugamushi]
MQQNNSDNENTKEKDLELNDKPKTESAVRSNSKLSELASIIRLKQVIALTFISITIILVMKFLLLLLGCINITSFFFESDFDCKNARLG